MLPLRLAFWTWRILSLTLIAGTSVLLARRGTIEPRQLLLLLVSAPLWTTLIDGQVYSVLMALAAFAWVCLEKHRDWRAGVTLGILAALKPNLAVWPLLLLFAGRWKAVLASAAAALGALGLATALFGIKTTLAWVEAFGIGSGMSWVESAQRATPGTAAIGQNASLTSLALRHGLDWLAQPASLALIVAALVWVRIARPLIAQLNTAAVGVSLLAAPLAWVGYTLMLAPRLLRERWGAAEWAAVLLLCVPLMVVLRVQQDLYCAALALLTLSPVGPSLTALGSMRARIAGRLGTRWLPAGTTAP